MEWLFWGSFGLVFYTYLGYGVVVALLIGLRYAWKGDCKQENCALSAPDASSDFATQNEDELPHVSLVIAAWNERSILADKVRDIEGLTYPAYKLHVAFVTDGSDDGSDAWLRSHTDYDVYHEDARRGKTAALNRVMPLVETPIVVFTDANTHLHPEALQRLVAPYQDSRVGAVSGEKRVGLVDTDKAHGAGEGLYWRYESLLKKMDFRLHTVVGAAGELFSVRTELFKAVPEDTILDDFMITLGIVDRGYRTAYVADAWALEAPSASLTDEWKRKTRICAGGFQSMLRLPGMLNVFRHPTATFQYVSHRLLRWAVAPFLLPIMFLANAFLAVTSLVYAVIFLVHVAFYAAAFWGWTSRNSSTARKWLFTPLYFLMMNAAAWTGLWRYVRGNQSAAWIRARRAG